MSYNYDAELQRIITAAKVDKSLAQPWRNKIVARLDEVQAFVMMAKHRTNLQPPEGDLSVRAADYIPESRLNDRLELGCICPQGGRTKDCPQHGWNEK